MPSLPVRAVRSLVFVVFAVSACVSSRDGTRAMRIPGCPSFNLKLQPITVQPNGGPPIELTQNGLTRITFSQGAVSQNTTYNVNGVTDSAGNKVAGVGFTPGTGPFNEPVLLRISYAGCGFPDNARPFMVTRPGGGDWTPIVGGGNSQSQKYVEAYIDHFTDFAIAL